MDEIVIKVENVSKTFKLPHEKQTSIKSAVVNFYRRKKTYEMQEALKDISFQVKKGEFFGIVGRNGSGKSTLLKLLAGIYMPTLGHVTVYGKLTPFIELGVGFNAELTGRENVYLNGALLGFNRKEMQAMYNDVVSFAELEKFMDQKLKNYSSGMQVRLAFSLAIRAQSDVLLVDEVLAVGDADFQRKCFAYFNQLKKDKKTVVFVSHDMGAVRDFCDRGILIDGGEVMFEGKATDIAKEYSKLFMASEQPEGKTIKNKRLGNGDMRIIQTRVVVGDEIVVTVKAKVRENIDELIYGLHVLSQDGTEVTAMNNRMINIEDAKDLKSGDEITFTWKMLNVLSEGKYNLMLTLTDGTYTTLDYLEDAASFRVKREESSNTAILPPISVDYIIK